MSPDAIRELARHFPGRWDHHYIAAKIKSDPLYEAVLAEFRESELPLLDLGCGLGLLAFFLRHNGLGFPILSLDYDQRKILEARRVAGELGLERLDFEHHDAREGLPAHQGNVSILDILQFFKPAEQQLLLTEAAERVAPGGKLVIRSGLRDRSLRFRITVAGDLFAKWTFWMKAAPVYYPGREDFEQALSDHGRLSISPLWGGTPFNNHLIVLTKATAG